MEEVKVYRLSDGTLEPDKEKAAKKQARINIMSYVEQKAEEDHVYSEQEVIEQFFSNNYEDIRNWFQVENSRIGNGLKAAKTLEQLRGFLIVNFCDYEGSKAKYKIFESVEEFKKNGLISNLYKIFEETLKSDLEV